MSLRSLLAQPRPTDVLPAAALFALGQTEVLLGRAGEPEWAIGLLTVLLTAPLLLRRRLPLLVLTTTLVAIVALSAVAPDPDGGQAAAPLALGLASYSAGRHLDPRRSWAGLAVLLGTLAIALAVTDAAPDDFAAGGVLFGGAWAFGRGLRARGERIEVLSAHADRLERERAVAERAAIAAERSRIARELHDIVSHSVSVVVLQTQAVRRRLEPTQTAERDDLRAVETTARQAMDEMRRLFGVLRADGDAPSLAPQPGLDQLDRLLQQTRDAGIDADLRIEGERVPLPPGVDLAAFRVIQEGLTNVRKHAAGAPAHVILRFDPEAVEIAVEDEGPGGQGSPGPSAGYGLVGMRERVTLYGGTMSAGSRDGGGFQLRVRLPIAAGASG